MHSDHANVQWRIDIHKDSDSDGSANDNPTTRTDIITWEDQSTFMAVHLSFFLKTKEGV